jgi:hypothetical protein
MFVWRYHDLMPIELVQDKFSGIDFDLYYTPPRYAPRCQFCDAKLTLQLLEDFDPRN